MKLTIGAFVLIFCLLNEAFLPPCWSPLPPVVLSLKGRNDGFSALPPPFPSSFFLVGFFFTIFFFRHQQPLLQLTSMRWWVDHTHGSDHTLYRPPLKLLFSGGFFFFLAFPCSFCFFVLFITVCYLGYSLLKLLLCDFGLDTFCSEIWYVLSSSIPNEL